MSFRAIFLACLLLALPMRVLAAEPFARAEVVTKGKIIAGQQMEIAVDVLVPNFFQSAPDFALFDLKDAIVALPDGRAENLVETVDGVQYSGIRRIYVVIPQVAGDYTLPAVTFAVTYANDDSQPTQGSASLQPIKFSVGPVPGDWADQTPFVAGAVTISQSLDRDPAQLKAGEALVRSIVISAKETRAMMIPAPTFATPEGLKLYQASPTLAEPGADSDNPDVASRKEIVTYIAEEPGSFVVPGLTLKWCDASKGKIATASAPAIQLNVKANPTPVQAIPAGEPQSRFDNAATARGVNRDLARIALTILVTVILYTGFFIFSARLGEAWRAFLGRRAQSEPAYFGRVRQALSAGEPQAIWSGLDIWTRRLGYRSISAWASSVGDGALQQALAGLERLLFGGGSETMSSEARLDLQRCIVAGRQQTLASGRRLVARHQALPPLNP